MHSCATKQSTREVNFLQLAALCMPQLRASVVALFDVNGKSFIAALPALAIAAKDVGVNLSLHFMVSTSSPRLWYIKTHKLFRVEVYIATFCLHFVSATELKILKQFRVCAHKPECSARTLTLGKN